MKKGTIWIVLTCLMVTSMVLASCNQKTATSTSTTTSTTTTTKTTTTTSSAPPTTSTTTTTGTKNWWDKLGTPQYGGEMVLQGSINFVFFDPYLGTGGASFYSAYMEPLFCDDWALDPTIFNYSINFRPTEYTRGFLANTWEFSDPHTLVIHLRQGIHWQNIAPVNGREFVASDVAYSYNRLYGLGDGFTTPAPYWSTVAAWKDLASVTTIDKYTVAFKWKSSNPEIILETIEVGGVTGVIICPEVVKQWGILDNWHQAVGTGAFLVQDFVSGSSVTLVRNSNYWGYDERYPQNQLPYINTIKLLIIPDTATALAGLRTGKTDAVAGNSFANANSVQKTNHEILSVTSPGTTSVALEPRNDTKPFNDIRVRQALQMAINLQDLASSYYQGSCTSIPSSLTSQYQKGWGFTYAQWPQSLKDQYTYNPTAAKKLLADAGYPTGFSTTIIADSTGDLDLLQIVKSWWADIGVTVDINPMDSASLSRFSRSPQFTTIDNRKLSALGRVYNPADWLAIFNVGGNDNICKVNDPVYDAYLPKALAAATINEFKQIVSDADQHVAENHYAISLLTPNLFNLYQPWLKGYNGQEGTIQESPVGFTRLSFYGGRFWIDQNLKKSMGH